MTPRIQPITMPKWGIEMQEGTITAWHFEPGQPVDKGDMLLDVETEKIVNSVEAPVSGVLRRIIGQPGEIRAVGALIGVFAAADVPDAEVEGFVRAFKAADASFEPASGASTAPLTTATSAAAAAGTAGSSGETRVSPIAQRLAERLGVDLSRIRGTGRNGRISKEDVEAFVAAQAATHRDSSKPAPPGIGNTFSREKLSPMRATIARRLVESKQEIPHYRLAIDVDAGALLAHRDALRSGGTTVSVNDLVVRACALALTQHPQVNAHLEGDEVVRFSAADVCLAVATDVGLITPVLRAANTKPLPMIASESRALAERARSASLTREEISGGTFTVSNLGMYGLDRFDAVINPPQVAILAVGAIRDAVLPRNGAAIVGKLLSLTLSCDHRVVDGAVGAAFLRTLRELLEHPGRL